MIFQCLIDEIRWTPVEEELPEYDHIPLLFWNEGTADHKPGCYAGWYSDKVYDGQRGRWFDIYGNPIYAGVTYWTPFPKGPDCTLRIGLEIIGRT